MKKLQIRKGEFEELSFEEVLKRYTGLIKKFASPYQSIYDFDDLFQVGSIALWKAYERYDMKKGCTFTTYAYNQVHFAIQTYHRDMTYKFSNKLSKVRGIMTCDMSELLERDNQNFCIFDIEKHFGLKDIVEIIKSFRDQKRWIWQLHIQGFNKSEIGRKLGVSGWWVTVSMREDVKIIKKKLKAGA